jgi:hypothetical protein
MNVATILWLVVFGISAAMFLGVAIIVSVKGFSDLKELLGNQEDVTRRPSDDESDLSGNRK